MVMGSPTGQHWSEEHNSILSILQTNEVTLSSTNKLDKVLNLEALAIYKHRDLYMYVRWYCY